MKNKVSAASTEQRTEDLHPDPGVGRNRFCVDNLKEFLALGRNGFAGARFDHQIECPPPAPSAWKANL
jgi:hypothetical protein